MFSNLIRMKQLRILVTYLRTVYHSFEPCCYVAVLKKKLCPLLELMHRKKRINCKAHVDKNELNSNQISVVILFGLLFNVIHECFVSIAVPFIHQGILFTKH